MAITYIASLTNGDEFLRLFESTGWNEEYRMTRDELLRAEKNSWYRIAAYDGERLVGYGRVVSDGILHAMVYDLITDPVYRGKGIGSEVLCRLVAKCREAGIRDIQLFSARGKRPFYEKRGFVARQDDGPGMEYATPAFPAVRE